MYNPLYEDPYGVWEVINHHSDKGDNCLGIYQGYIDEIAFTLAGVMDAYLIFRKLNVKQPIPSAKSNSVEVNIQLDPNYTPYLQTDILRSDVDRMLQNRPGISIQLSSKYASVIKLTNEKCRDKLIESALKKLTDEEKKALGVFS